MATTNKHYVGVTGASSVEEAKGVSSLMRGSGFTMKGGHVPMLGFQASWRSINFGFSEGNRRVPRTSELPAILESVKGEAFLTVHYYTKNPDRLIVELGAILGAYGLNLYGSGMVDGIQINRTFPSPGEINTLKDTYPDLKMILQVYLGEDSAEALAKNLTSNYGMLDYIIIDYSHGNAREADIPKITLAHRMLIDNGVNAEIVFAGGFTGSNVREKVSLLKGAVGGLGFSIDAEGGLRDRVGTGYGNDILNMNKVKEYLRGASESLLAQN